MSSRRQAVVAFAGWLREEGDRGNFQLFSNCYLVSLVPESAHVLRAGFLHRHRYHDGRGHDGHARDGEGRAGCGR
eukprot:13169671-Alexandrium_andersonii.AAC.1